MSAHTDQAVELMQRFAARTGVSAPSPPERYLWTDAFAVCTFLGLARTTGESRYTDLALRLVDQVHHVLGRHRADDRRAGWISGLDEAQGEAHPTAGGLRIGKPLAERAADEPLDERLEWERDGQYFHYLTKWMHALDLVARSTGQPRFNQWARELACAAHRAFAYVPRAGGRRRMYWKVSIDLSRPLVRSMGQHDPLDGLVTCLQLQAGAQPEPGLDAAIADFTAMLEPRGLATADPLGIGGLLTDAYRLAQLEPQGGAHWALVELLLDAALVGLEDYRNQPDLHLPAARRLAFRELGLAIGLAALERDAWRQAPRGARDRIDLLVRHLPVRREIERFWLQPEHRVTEPWREHANINDVMLATSLRPEGYLTLST